MDHIEQYLGARNAVTASEDQIKKLAAEHELSPVEFVIIVLIGRGKDRPGSISTEAAIGKATLSHHISNLAQRGLLKREPVDEDARGLKLCLTEAGQTIAASIPESF